MSNPLADVDEQELAVRIANCDVAARDELVRRHWWLCRAASRRYRGWERADAEQEAGLALLEAATNFRAGWGEFRKVAARAIRTAFRRRRAIGTVSINSHPDLVDSLASTEPSPDTQGAVRRAMTLMREHERVQLRRRGGFLDGGAARRLREALTKEEA